MNDYLMHYGVLGMKWGVRNYQNADGSLTAAGKKRYSVKKSFNDWRSGLQKTAKEEYLKGYNIAKQGKEYGDLAKIKANAKGFAKGVGIGLAGAPIVYLYGSNPVVLGLVAFGETFASGLVTYKESALWNGVKAYENEQKAKAGKKYVDSLFKDTVLEKPSSRYKSKGNI